MHYEEMACHTWALAANPNTGAQIHRDYEVICGVFGERYGYGTNLRGKSLTAVRLEAMQEISVLCERRVYQVSNEVYLCGGFRDGQVCPEHLWLEDHTSRITYDTFINKNIIMVGRVGEANQPFQPGCEAEAFGANEIARVEVRGFTHHQVTSISSLGEPRS